MEYQIAQVQQQVALTNNQILRNALVDSPKVREVSERDLAVAISGAIESAIFYAGLNTPAGDRDMLKIATIADVRRHFTHLTVAEVIAYIDNGVHGKYGEVKGIAPKDVFAWLMAGYKSQERREEVEKIAKQNQVSIEPTDEEKRLRRWENMIYAWESFKKQGSFKDHGNVVYTTLYENGKIGFTKERWEDFNRLAKAEVLASFDPTQHLGNFVKAGEFRAICEEIKTQGDRNLRVISAAQNIALNQFFSDLLEIDQEITELFE